MLDLTKDKWKTLDNDFVEIETNDIRILKHKDWEDIPIDCPQCNNLFGGAEDVEAFKRHKMCESCELNNWAKLTKE